MNSGKSKIIKAAEYIRRTAVEGEMRAGTRIVSARGLARLRGISSVTADRALRLLEKEGFVRRVKGCGTFVRNDPPRKLRIALANPVYPKNFSDPVVVRCFNEVVSSLAGRGIEPVILSEKMLLDTKANEQTLSAFDGLLLSFGFLNAETLPLLSRFPGKIVMFRMEWIIPELPAASQVIPDFIPPLKEFFNRFPLDLYDRILVVDSLRSAQAVSRGKFFLQALRASGQKTPEPEIISLNVSNYTGNFNSYQYFRKNMARFGGHSFAVSTSGFISEGIHAAFAESENKVEILSFDNQEGYRDEFGHTPYFTAIDAAYGRIGRESAELLLRLIETKDDRSYVIRVPGSLVVRDSILNGNMKLKYKHSATERIPEDENRLP